MGGRETEPADGVGRGGEGRGGGGGGGISERKGERAPEVLLLPRPRKEEEKKKKKKQQRPTHSTSCCFVVHSGHMGKMEDISGQFLLLASELCSSNKLLLSKGNRAVKKKVTFAFIVESVSVAVKVFSKCKKEKEKRSRATKVGCFNIL